MKRATIKSRIIMDLKEKLEQGKYNVLQEFWDMIEEQGTPLLEEMDEDTENTLVTFIFKDEHKIENVVMIPPIGWEKLEENKLERLLDTNVWYLTYRVKRDLRFSYYFSVNDPLYVDWNGRFYNLQHDQFCKKKLVFKVNDGKQDRFVSYAVMPHAEADLWVKENADVQKGKIFETRFKSERLENERKIRIYTPVGYNEFDDPYGILILTDGDEYINILSATSVLDNLISRGLIPPLVVLFIDSTINRYEELTCNDKFVEMIVKELLPWMKAKYNITNKPGKSIIGGLSIGGLTASYIALKYSSVFRNVLSQSGSYWYKPEDCNECNWLSSRFEEIDRLPIKFYLNVGVLEDKIRMIDTNINLRDVLIKKGYDVHYEEFKSGHDYLCWGETLGNGLISLVGSL